MRNVFTLILLVGIALAGVAVYIVQNYVGAYQQALAKEQSDAQKQVAVAPINTVDVYVAVRNIRYGEEITMDDVRTVKWPKGALPEGVFSTENPLYQEGDGLRVALRSIDVNEAILVNKVTEPGATAGLISQLEPGMRGYAIQVNAITGVAGFLRPHDRVDIYWTATPRVRDVNDDDNDEDNQIFQITRLIETGVKIIAVDQDYIADDNGGTPRLASTIVVAVTPTQAATLTLAQSSGSLSTTLIGLEDERTEMVEVSQHALLGLSRDQKKTENSTCTVKSRRGAEVVITNIPCPAN